MSDLKLGRGGKMGSVNAEQIKGGLKKEQIKDKNLQNIFDNVDVNKDGVLDADEIKKFQEQIQNAAGDDNLSNREAKKYLKQNNMKNIDKKDLFKFINELSQASENVVSSTVTENNGQKTVHIKYKDGTTETINPDKSTEIATQGENGQTITKYYDKDKKLVSQKTVDADGQTEVTEFGDDGKPTKTETTASGGNPIQTTAYKDGKPVKTELKDGTTVETYSYDEEGNPVLNKKVENKGIPAKERVINYTYNEDGTTTAHIKENGKETFQTIKEGKVVSETINENGKKTERTRTENGYTDVTDDGATTTTFNNENKKLSQTKTVDGKTYSVEYDGEGNTKGIIVQNGESIAALAKRFGCTEEAIKNANPGLVKGKGANVYFLVGQEIKIPKELEADDKALQGRVTKEQAVAGYEDFMAKKAAEEAAKRAEEEAAARAEQDAAEEAKEKQHRAEMQKQGKEIANDLFEDIDGIGTRKTFDANIKRINKDNVVEVIQGYTEKSPDESIAEAILDEAGMDIEKRKDAIKHIFNQLLDRAKEKGIDTTQAEQEFKEAINLKNGYANNEDFDAIFNSLCAAINGKSVLTKAEKEEIKNTPPETLQKETTQIMQDTVDGAEKSLNEQLAKDGWAADLWEGMKWCVGSDNLDEKVKADIDTYKKQLAELNTAKTPEEFKAKFKEIYGVEYDPELVKAYQKRQEQLPLAEATHGVEENFNTEMKELLAGDKLSAKTHYSPSSFGTGTYTEVASKADVYNERLNKFAEFIGQGDKEQGLKDIEQAFKDAGLPENASLDERYKVLHKLAKNYSEILHANTLEATEGKGYDAFKQEAENSYKAAFGLKNDIAKRVADYNTSQQTGDMIVKGVVKGGAAIGLCLIPGVGLAAAAIGTGIISATVDVSDRMSSDVGLKEEELGQILKNAAIDGATVFAGGQLTKMLANAKTFVKIGGQMVGDVATGAAAEKLQTGHITLNGVMFQCVFSAAGNLVAIKNMGKAPKDAPNVEVPKSNPAKELPPSGAVEKRGPNAGGERVNNEAGTGSSNGTGKKQRTSAADEAGGAESTGKKRTEETHRTEEARQAQEARRSQSAPKDEFANMKRSDLETEMSSLNDVISAKNKAQQRANNYKDITDIKSMRKLIIEMSEINDTTIRQKIIELKEAIDSNASPSLIKAKNNELKEALNKAAKVDVSKETVRLGKVKEAYIQKTSSEMTDKIDKLIEGQEFFISNSNKEYPDIGFPPKKTGASQLVIKRQNGKVILENIGDNPIYVNGKEIPKGQTVEIGTDTKITLADKTELTYGKMTRSSDAGSSQKVKEEPTAEETHRAEESRQSEEARKAEEARAKAKANGDVQYDNPELNKYVKSKNSHAKASVTAETYKQMDEYVENVYRQELKRLKKSYPDYDINKLKMEARFRAEQARPQDAEHFAWVKSRKDLFDENKMRDYDCWSGYDAVNQKHGPWKMHMYSIDENDWRDMCDVIIPYLKEHDIDWKTFNVRDSADHLNGSSQQGKAFTIYPRDNAHMAQVAKDLEYIIKMNKMNKTNTHITGDRQMGDSGRLFYRYEFKSGKYKNEILDLSNEADYEKYRQRYDKNRGGEKYLADDMTIEDDIWRNFDPSDPNAQPSDGASTTGNQRGRNNAGKNYNIPNDGVLQKGQSYELNNVSKIKMANYTLDLNDPNIRRLLDKLPEGGEITVGREGNIRVPEKYGEVSRIHVVITKRNGKIYIMDKSSNGTRVAA